ncbi:hypothetical protein ACJJTC_010956, partial [Scirpophaga incertulas]
VRQRRRGHSLSLRGEEVELNTMLSTDTQMHHSYPVLLHPCSSSTYACVHAGGLHTVTLPSWTTSRTTPWLVRVIGRRCCRRCAAGPAWRATPCARRPAAGRRARRPGWSRAPRPCRACCCCPAPARCWPGTAAVLLLLPRRPGWSRAPRPCRACCCCPAPDRCWP